MKIEVVPHDPNWVVAFQTESKQVATALGKNAVAIHHIGSTSIPDIYAKPIIDILIEVVSLDEVDACRSEMESLDYEVMGEFGIPGRRYFRKDDRNGLRTHQLHVFETCSPQIVRHLAFRDYLIAHPNESRRYSDLKRKLANEYPNDPEAYMDGKDPFIQYIDRRSALWKATLATNV